MGSEMERFFLCLINLAQRTEPWISPRSHDSWLKNLAEFATDRQE